MPVILTLWIVWVVLSLMLYENLSVFYKELFYNQNIAIPLMLFLNFCDWHSTHICVKQTSIEDEANPLARQIMKRWGTKGFAIFKLVFVSVLIFFMLHPFLLPQGTLAFTGILLFCSLGNYLSYFLYDPSSDQ